MKSHYKHDIPEELREQLDQYTVDVPPIPYKHKKSNRLADFLATPVKNPLENHSITPGLLLKIQLGPIVVTIALSASFLFIL
ncbi:hypothetical protein [Guptibacillus hwajinpoensis]|uniref:hypothetical protein n=1 Tax=Guptibacillus hwajinpoensis TaxID=208199 RepID=UPI0024B38B96|nr:hypothetical protein [Pseudalkalibacillus hwajinpoensis]